MKDAILFFTGRGADIFTTWLNVKLFGYSVEASPLWRKAMEAHGFGGFIVINLLISTLLFLAIRYTKKRWLMNLAFGLVWTVSFLNLGAYIFARLATRGM